MTRRWRVGLALAGLLVAGPAFADRPTTYYSTVTKTATSTSAQSAATLWTPASGKAFALQGCFAAAETPVRVRFLVSGVDVIPPFVLTSYGTALIGGGENQIYTSAIDAVLTYTTVITGLSATYPNTSVMCWGFEL